MVLACIPLSQWDEIGNEPLSPMDGWTDMIEEPAIPIDGSADDEIEDKDKMVSCLPAEYPHLSNAAILRKTNKFLNATF